jgi:hypothetical protein
VRVKVFQRQELFAVEKPKRFSVTLPSSLHKRFKLMCVSSDKLMADAICDILEREVDRYDRAKAAKTAARPEARP